MASVWQARCIVALKIKDERHLRKRENRVLFVAIVWLKSVCVNTETRDVKTSTGRYMRGNERNGNRRISIHKQSITCRIRSWDSLRGTRETSDRLRASDKTIASAYRSLACTHAPATPRAVQVCVRLYLHFKCVSLCRVCYHLHSNAPHNCLWMWFRLVSNVSVSAWSSREAVSDRWIDRGMCVSCCLFQLAVPWWSSQFNYDSRLQFFESPTHDCYSMCPYCCVKTL